MYMEAKKSRESEKTDEITLIEFANLVKQMRHNQRRYILQRRPEVLETCNRLEQQVDEIVSKITEVQLSFFE